MRLKIYRKKSITKSRLNHLKPNLISIGRDLYRYFHLNIEIRKLEEKR
jgi:hypothetical protein